jgi:hypothetical protein
MQGMSLADAAFNTAHEYPHGGADGLGRRMGKSNLSAEVNPNRADAKLGLLDALRMQLLTGDFRILNAMAWECGFFPPMPMPSALPSDAPCLRTLGEMMKECADVVATVSTDAADGRFDDNDLARANREVGELLLCVQRLMGQLTAMNAELRARAPAEPGGYTGRVAR